MNPDVTSSSKQPLAVPPSAADRSRNAFWQFSLQSLLLIVLAGCLLAGYLRERWAHLAEYQRRIDISRGLDREQERLRQLDQKEKDAPKFLTVADRRLINVKAAPFVASSSDEDSWSWTIYLPPHNDHLWLYISQGSKWDAREGKYVDGAVSGAQLMVSGEQALVGRVVRDYDGGTYINVWSAGGCQTARMSDAGYAAFRAGVGEVREVTGEAEQQVLSPETSSQDPMQLLRWHRVRSEYETTIPIDAVREYGFSIYLVDLTPGPRPRSPRPLAP